MSELANVAGFRFVTPEILMTARSCVVSIPTMDAGCVPPLFGSVTVMAVAPLTTCAFVTISPSAVMMMPVPAPLSWKPRTHRSHRSRPDRRAGRRDGVVDKNDGRLDASERCLPHPR